MANNYRMVNTRGDVRLVRSSSFHVFDGTAGDRFAKATCHPVLVVDQTDGDRFVGIYGAAPLPDRLDRIGRLSPDDAKVAEWEEWAAAHALHEYVNFGPRVQQNRAQAIRRRYNLLYRAAKRREGKVFPEMTPELTEALDAARRAEEVAHA